MQDRGFQGDVMNTNQAPQAPTSAGALTLTDGVLRFACPAGHVTFDASERERGYPATYKALLPVVDAMLSAIAERDARIAELERAQADAARLDFIERNWFYVDGDERLGFGFTETWSSPSKTLRAAIDAHIALAATRRNPR